MIGTSWIREQGLKDPLLVEIRRERDMDDVSLWGRKFPERYAAMRRWDDLAKFRDGPVNPVRTEVDDLRASSEEIKRRARDLRTAMAGITALRPEYCHICVDVCPDGHNLSGDARKKDLHRSHLKERKAEGHQTPKSNNAAAGGTMMRGEMS